jgi:hypothetical protein
VKLTVHLQLLQRIKLCGAELPLTFKSFWFGVYMSTWTNSKALSLPNAKVGAKDRSAIFEGISPPFATGTETNREKALEILC